MSACGTSNTLHRRTAVALAVSALLAFPTAAPAINFSFNVATGEWFNDSNWAPTGVPTDAEDVGINNGGEAQISNGGSAAAKLLSVGFDFPGASKVTITEGSLTVGGNFYIGEFQPAIGTLTVSGPNARFRGKAGGTGVFYVGSAGQGSLIVENGGKLEVSASGGILIGRLQGGTGEMIVQGQGSKAAVPVPSQAVFIGHEGSGTLTVRDEGVFEAANFRSLKSTQKSQRKVDNGIRRLVRDQSELFRDMPAGSIQVGPGGMTIDTQGFEVRTDPSAHGIEGAGGLTKAGDGTLLLTNANTYSGPTNVNAGALRVEGGNAIGDSSAVSVASGATLALGGAETIGSLARAGKIDLGTNTLNAGGNSTALSPSRRRTSVSGQCSQTAVSQTRCDD
jgi:autotransporter-associated beta strand protein/T5SS/PEP-CTERM-associated repeat protein